MSTNNIPEFIKRDPADIMAECKATLQQYLGREEIEPTQIEQLILDAIVYREVLLVNRFNAGMAQMLYQFSHAPVLDYIAGLVGVERLSEAKASCLVRFNLQEGHGGVLIRKGTRVASSDGKAVFETTVDLSVNAGINHVNTYVSAQQAGTFCNGYAIGKINTILDPEAFIRSVENLDVTGGGSDMETDEQLRERIKLAPSQYSSAGSRQSYLYHAKSANSMIKDVVVNSEEAGTVVIVPLVEDEESFAAVRADVEAACNDEKVRPLTDTVIVKQPVKVDYSIEVEIPVYENASKGPIQDKIEAALLEYSHQKREALGQDIILSHISQVCRLEDVYDVKIISPKNNVEVRYDQYANLVGDIVVKI